MKLSLRQKGSIVSTLLVVGLGMIAAHMIFRSNTWAPPLGGGLGVIAAGLVLKIIWWRCPNCHGKLGLGRLVENCPHCGEKIDYDGI